MLAKEVPVLPRGEDWIYEFAWAGERVRAIKHGAGVHLLSRDGRDFTNRFPRIAATVAKLRVSNAILDGEILYLESYSGPALRFLAQATDDLTPGSLALLAYDLLSDNDRDLRQYSLLARRLLLASRVQGTSIILSPLIDGNCETALASAARLGFRGVVAKRAGSLYRPNSLSAVWVNSTFAACALPPAGHNFSNHPFGLDAFAMGADPAVARSI
jgi:bifunctional non-homologous end joining protein LigD